MKKLRILSQIILISMVAVAISFTSCNNDDGTPVPTEKAYIGSAECQSCHTEIYDKFVKSGHPYKLSKVENGVQPSIPYTTDAGMVFPTPAGYTWADISYIIGGYGWKVRFIDNNGYIITGADDTQYNIADGSQVAYHGDDPAGTVPYNCGRCHTTGWVSVDDGASPKDGLPGMAGDFFAGGVHCEQCHGMGNIHAVTEAKEDITLDETPELCGGCHYRNEDHTIAASGGFIKHHEQYDEWLTSGGHKDNNITCNTCHDPHASVINDDVAPGQGVTKTCEECHPTYDASAHEGLALDCITCHMPKVSKSAIKTGDYAGDINTHIFKINTAADGTMFNDDGSIANPDGLGVSLDYVCYQCHKDANGLGGAMSAKTMEELSAKATGFHGTK